jgi:EmrB/QacA subfamily drug resistance transporter
MFMGTLVTTVVAVALPVLGPDLRLSYSEALWVQAAYPLAMAVVLIPVGRLADRRGLMRFYLIGVAIFGVFSIACALAFSGPFLIVVRCLQGAGGGFMAGTSAALVTTVFPPHERGRGLGLNVMAGYVGLMAGPPIGGLIVSHASWRWIFIISIPLALITLMNGWFLLGAERRDRAASREAPAGAGATHLDWVGTALLGALLICLLVPLISIPFWGWTSPITLGLLGGFVVFLVAFVLVEDRVRDPVLNLGLVRKNRVFAAGTSAALLNYAAVYGVTTFTAVFLEIVQGYTAQRAGLYLLVQPVFMAGLSPVFGRLSDRIGQRIPATGGMLLAAAGTAQLGLLPSPAPAWRVLVALGVVGIGMAAFSSPNTSSVMGSVKRSELSLASGFLGTMRTAGQGLSVALLGGIAASGLGPTGGRVLFLGEKASEAAASTFSDGYRMAMLVAAGLAVVGALVSLVRGPRQE